MPTTAANQTSTESAKPRNYFATTHWSVVLSAGRNDTTRSHIALETLCCSYWYPIYAFIRRRGYSAHDAEDLTQGFLSHLLDSQTLINANPDRGRFRSFLLGAVNHFLANEWAKSQAQKRGGGKPVVSLDAAEAEHRFDLEPATASPPEETFDKEWATALLNKVLTSLEQHYKREGNHDLFAALKQTLAGSRENQPYALLAAQLNTSEGAIKTAVHRLRKRYRQLLEAEIANTVASPVEVKDELAYLLRIMAS